MAGAGREGSEKVRPFPTIPEPSPEATGHVRTAMKALAIRRPRSLVACTFVLTLGCAAACTGQTVGEPITGGDGGGGGSSGASSSGGGDDGGLVTGCPSSAPAAGSACGTQGLECEYGTDPDLACETIARCDSTGWTVTPPATNGCPTQPPASSCPASYASVPQNQTCTTAASCTYPQGTCSCEVYCGSQYPTGHMCEAGTPMTWQCNGPMQGCPASRPLVGSACTDNGLMCDYGDCNAIGVVCTSGTWHTMHNGCPISARRAKEGIHYLGDDELRAIADEALATRLATYSYKFGDANPRLGFIIDDQPDSPAVVAGKERVDLYAYASMAIATVQVQDREIEELRAEMRDLRRRLDACPADKDGPARAKRLGNFR